MQYFSPAGDQSLAAVQIRYRGLDIGAEKMFHMLQDIRILHKFIPKIFAKGVLGYVILCRPKPTGKDNDICPGLGFLKGCKNMAAVILYRRNLVYGDPYLM